MRTFGNHAEASEGLFDFTPTRYSEYADTHTNKRKQDYATREGIIPSAKPESNMRFTENPSIIKRICLRISRGFTNCGIFNHESSESDDNNVDVPRPIFCFLCHCCVNKEASKRKPELDVNSSSQYSKMMIPGRNITEYYSESVTKTNSFRSNEHSDNLLSSDCKSGESCRFGCRNTGTYLPPYGESSALSNFAPFEINNISMIRSLDEEDELKAAPWFQEGIPRELMLEVLRKKPVGSFIVREATTKPGCYALSVRVPNDMKATGIAHYLIIHTHKGYKIKGSIKEFRTLSSLVTHHSIMQEFLPCPLLLERPAFNRSSKSSHNRDFETLNNEQDYDIIGDIRQMLEDIKL